MTNKIKKFCLILSFFIIVALSSELVFSTLNINDEDCKRLCLEKDKDSGINEFCYNELMIIRCDCGGYNYRGATLCDDACRGYSESKYCPPNSCEYICPWRRGACHEDTTTLGTRATFEYGPSSWDECEKRTSEDMKCADKDGYPDCTRPGWSNWLKVFVFRCFGLKDAYWKKCSVPKSMGDCGTGESSTTCDENGCSVSTITSAKLIVPENALPKQQDAIEEGQTIVNLGTVISIGKDYAFYDYTQFENSRIIMIYNFYPANLVFDKPSTLVIDYIHEMADGMIENENGLDIYYYANGLWLPLDALQNIYSKTLTTYTNKLGTYALIELVDTTPPNITLDAEPNILWPPNNKYIDITLSGNIIDDISGIDKNSITLMVDNIQKEINLDESGNFRVIAPLLASRLGAEKEGHKYNISLRALDNVGNIASNSAFVLVPHDLNLYNDYIEKTK